MAQDSEITPTWPQIATLDFKAFLHDGRREVDVRANYLSQPSSYEANGGGRGNPLKFYLATTDIHTHTILSQKAPKIMTLNQPPQVTSIGLLPFHLTSLWSFTHQVQASILSLVGTTQALLLLLHHHHHHQPPLPPPQLWSQRIEGILNFSSDLRITTWYACSPAPSHECVCHNT